MIGLASIVMTFPTMPLVQSATNVMPQNLQVFIEAMVELQQIQGQGQGLLTAAVVPGLVKANEKGQNLEINILGLAPSLVSDAGVLDRDQGLVAGLVAGLPTVAVVQGKDFLRYGRNT